MNPINAVEVTTLESLFQVAYEATIQAEQQRHHWNGRKFSEQADAAWESFHDACDRFRRQYRPARVPVDPDYEEDYAILEGPTRTQELEQVTDRFLKTVSDAGFTGVDRWQAFYYLESNDFDPQTAYREFLLCNPDSREEALTAAQRNK